MPATPHCHSNQEEQGRPHVAQLHARGRHATWQRQEGEQAASFPATTSPTTPSRQCSAPRRDSTVSVAAGWDLLDFGTPWPRGKLPKDANVSEMIVGFFDRERASGQMGTAAEINENLAQYCRGERTCPRPRNSPKKICRASGKSAESCSRSGTQSSRADALEIPFDPTDARAVGRRLDASGSRRLRRPIC